MADKKTVEKNNIEIPKELLDLIKAEDTTLEIARICFENEIREDAKIRGISYHTGRVLVGDLPPEDLEKNLAEKVKISSFLASKIDKEINESIFYPVKESLAILYGNEAITSKELPTNYPEAAEEEPGGKNKKGKDVYQEPIE